MMWRVLDHIGSGASICGFLLGIYILAREIRMAREVHVLKAEEEKWHEKR